MRSHVNGGQSSRSFRSRLNVVNSLLLLPSVASKLFGYIGGCDVRFYFSLAVSGSIGDTFGLTNARRHRSKILSSKIKIRSLILKVFSFVYV